LCQADYEVTCRKKQLAKERKEALEEKRRLEEAAKKVCIPCSGAPSSVTNMQTHRTDVRKEAATAEEAAQSDEESQRLETFVTLPALR